MYYIILIPFQIVQGNSAAVCGLVAEVRSLVSSNGSNLDNVTLIMEITELAASNVAEIAGGSAAAVFVVLSDGAVLWYWYQKKPCKT
jgi:hypothetical protein